MTGKRIVYPTGLIARRWQYKNASGSILIEVEQCIQPSRLNLTREEPGDATLSGSLIPKGARGPLGFESLPCRTFKVRNYRWPFGVSAGHEHHLSEAAAKAAALRDARKLARAWLKKLSPSAK